MREPLVSGSARGAAGLALLLLGCVTPGCAFLRSPSTPMPAVHHAAASGPADGLIVFLPGFGDGPDHFEDNDFVDLVREANPRFDVIAADAHFGYYRGFTVLERLHADLIEPVRHKYRRVWIVGISMGGLGAATYAMAHEDLVEGVILLAPYMGGSDVIEEVRAAGGLAAWTPPQSLDNIEDDATRKYYELWSWYRGYADQRRSRPRLYIGYGEDDRLSVPNGLVAAVLPDERKKVTPGGHKWRTWRPLFADLVRRALAE